MDSQPVNAELLSAVQGLLYNPYFFAAGMLAAAALLAVFVLIHVKTKYQKLWYSLLTLLVVLGFRALVLFLGKLELGEKIGFEGAFLTLADSFIHSLQTFSLDEDYTQFTAEGQRLLSIYGNNTVSALYGVAVSILNIVAPVLSGALFLDLLTKVFPTLRIWAHPFTDKIVFSELNEASICLAKDIASNRYNEELRKMNVKRKPLIIFSDTYTDQDSEASSELLSLAKAIKAVCVKNDLLELPLQKTKSVSYILIDENVTNSITSFTQLMNRENEKAGESANRGRTSISGKESQKLPSTRIYLFVRDEYQAEIANRIYTGIDKNAEKVIFRVIRDYKNAVINLMYNVPLFLPLLDGKRDGEKQKDLHITILGSGRIAQEVFKSIYWCGQMLNVRLHVNVLSETADRFKGEISKSCPELLESCNQNAKLLQVFPCDPSKPYSEPYIHELRVEKMDDVRNLSSYPEDILQKTQYYVVALGSDEKSAETTKYLSDKLSRMALKKACPERIMVAPAVFNPKLAKSIEDMRNDGAGNGLFIIPFAVLDERFSFENVFMVRQYDDAEQTAQVYDQAHQKKLQQDEYKYWANIAKAIHAPYKMFSFGLLEWKAPRPAEDSGREEGREWTKMYQCRKDAAINQITDPMQAWLEKRRWNAFMRAEGFSYPDKTEFEAYFNTTKNYKNMLLKYHPCLVERDKKDTLPLPDSPDYDQQKYDCLDYVSMQVFHALHGELYGNELRKEEFKQWDTIQYDSALQNFFPSDGKQ